MEAYDEKDKEAYELRKLVALKDASYLELEGKMKQVEADNVRLNQCVQEAKGEIAMLKKESSVHYKCCCEQHEKLEELSSWAERVSIWLRNSSSVYPWADDLLNSLPKWMKEGK